MYKPRKLELYSDAVEQCDNYCGEKAIGYYIVYSRCRDSDLIVESNWQAIIDGMPNLTKDGESYDEAYNRLRVLDEDVDNPHPALVWRSGHWAVGWLEHLLVHESRREMLEYGDECIDSIESYPILDDGLWSDMEYERIQEDWKEYECNEFKERLIQVAKKKYKGLLEKKEIKKIVKKVDEEKLLDMWFEMGYDTFEGNSIFCVYESVIEERFQPFEKLFAVC